MTQLSFIAEYDYLLLCDSLHSDSPNSLCGRREGVPEWGALGRLPAPAAPYGFRLELEGPSQNMDLRPLGLKMMGFQLAHMDL